MNKIINSIDWTEVAFAVVGFILLSVVSLPFICMMAGATFGMR